MDVEDELTQLRASGKLREVATLIVERYGPEVLSFLATMLPDHADAGDAFAQACEDLWKGLPGFAARSSMKTWFYALARHAASRLRRSPYRKRQAPLSEIAEVAAAVHSRTQPHLRSEIKVGVAAIRDTLDETDRALLVLRVDRGMSWTDVARVMSDDADNQANHEAELTRAAARLRKRFQSVKETIRERARSIGLVTTDAMPDHE